MERGHEIERGPSVSLAHVALMKTNNISGTRIGKAKEAGAGDTYRIRQVKGGKKKAASVHQHRPPDTHSQNAKFAVKSCCCCPVVFLGYVHRAGRGSRGRDKGKERVDKRREKGGA